LSPEKTFRPLSTISSISIYFNTFVPDMHGYAIREAGNYDHWYLPVICHFLFPPGTALSRIII